MSRNLMEPDFKGADNLEHPVKIDLMFADFDFLVSAVRLAREAQGKLAHTNGSGAEASLMRRLERAQSKSAERRAYAEHMDERMRGIEERQGWRMEDEG